MVAMIAAVSVMLLALIAELLHARRIRRVSHLAFGPKGKPLDWALWAPLARCLGLALLTWGLITLYVIDPRFRRPGEIPDAALRRIIICLDVSPSMSL